MYYVNEENASNRKKGFRQDYEATQQKLPRLNLNISWCIFKQAEEFGNKE